MMREISLIISGTYYMLWIEICINMISMICINAYHSTKNDTHDEVEARQFFYIFLKEGHHNWLIQKLGN